MASSDTDPLEVLAEFVAEAPLSEPVWHERARTLLADALVLARAADTVPSLDAVLGIGAGEGKHRSWATGARMGPADAVQANATAICARFQEDTEMSSWAHPGSFVVPAAVEAAVDGDRSLGSMLDGLVAGYATTSWLGGDGYVATAMMSRGLRPSPNFAPAGACAAACRTLGLTAEQTRHALGAAVLVGRGTLHSVGAGGDDWRLHNSGAARDGFGSALAAARGMTSGAGALTSPQGFLATMTGSPVPPDAWALGPSGDLVLEVWNKDLPTLGDNMAVALAARDLYHRLDGATPSRAVVHMNAQFAEFPGTQTGPPFRTRTAALASVRFVTAKLLLTGTLELADYDRRDDPDLVKLAGRVEVVAEEDLDFTDAVVEVEARAHTYRCRTSEDLPRTLFFRDPDGQRAAAVELLGERGGHLVDAVLAAEASSTAGSAVEQALDVCEPSAGAARQT